MEPLGWVLTSVVVLSVYAVLSMLMKLRRGVCRSKADLTGKTVLITGANSGIGYFTALDLATRNARVIMACRDMVKGRHAQSQIQKETGNNNVVVHQLDLSSMASVRKCATQIVKEERHLDVLINNAGVSGLPFKKTDDGLEYMFATNHFGPFLLTNLLLELLERSAPSRIVNVSSVVHKWIKLDLNNMCSEKYFSVPKVYFASKLANVLFTRELARRLEGTGVTANSLHPGTVDTQMSRNMSWWWRHLSRLLLSPLFRSPEEGAQTSIFLAVSEDVEGISGKYFSECGLDRESREAQDDGKAKKLWEISEKLTGLVNDS